MVEFTGQGRGVRIICFLPDMYNRYLQAAAAMDGRSKQVFMQTILEEWVEKNTPMLRDNKPEQPSGDTPKKKRAKKAKPRTKPKAEQSEPVTNE